VGCDLPDPLGRTVPRPIEQGDDLLLASQDLVASRDAIGTRVGELVTRLGPATAG
jgi:hypothetical protein